MRSKVPEDLIIANNGLAAFVELLRHHHQKLSAAKKLRPYVDKAGDKERFGGHRLSGVGGSGIRYRMCSERYDADRMRECALKPQKASRIGLSLSPSIANRVTKDLTVTAMPFELGLSLGVVVN